MVKEIDRFSDEDDEGLESDLFKSSDQQTAMESLATPDDLEVVGYDFEKKALRQIVQDAEGDDTNLAAEVGGEHLLGEISDGSEIEVNNSVDGN